MLCIRLQRCLLFLLLATPLMVWATQAPEEKTVLLAILARNKAHVLPEFLRCIDNLTYDKKQIVVYINTNNNEDSTKEVLEEWVKRQGPLYRAIIFESHEANIASARPHEWTLERVTLLGAIRNKSMQKALETKCAYYFVVDCDNFIIPCTLETLIAKDKPIIAPMLRSKPHPNDPYSNYFCAVTKEGYYHPHENQSKIFRHAMVGTFRVPLVHCTYLIKSQYIPKLTYVDDSGDYEFVIFSRSARNNDIRQYICNEKSFGWLLHFYDDVSIEEEKKRFQAIMKTIVPPAAVPK